MDQPYIHFKEEEERDKIHYSKMDHLKIDSWCAHSGYYSLIPIFVGKKKNRKNAKYSQHNGGRDVF